MKNLYFRMSRSWILLLLLSIFSFERAAYGQETSGTLSGRVLDKAQNPIAGASLEAIHSPSGTRYTLSSDKAGRFTINNMRIGGPYKVSATMIGMQADVRTDVFIRLGVTQQLDLQLLQEFQLVDEVVVKVRKQRQNSDQNGAAKHITADQVQQTPTVNRSFTDITRLTPQGSRDNNFAGNNFRYNNVTIDGAINNDAIGFSPSLGGQTGTSGMPGSSTRTNPISIDAIQDMQVYLAPFDVKIGNFTGGSVNAVTRSGTNKVEGSLYGFGRNATVTGKDRVGGLGKMNKDFYDMQAGIRIGFPIIKDKLFFFSNEEITRRQDPTQMMIGSTETDQILSIADAELISRTVEQRYGDIFQAGTAGHYNNTNRSTKFFNRLDWNITDRMQLAIRNNTIFSKASHMDRDQQDYRFSSMAFQQTNNQSSTVAELKTRINNEWSANAVLGFTIVKDKRDPLSDPSLAQIQIQGRKPGRTIYIGTDREASIFNMKQKTWELTANVNWNIGRHKVLFGTHNELYKIHYGFVNSWNGRVDYNSIEDFVENNPYRVRGSYNYSNNTRNYILQHPAAEFQVNMYSLYVQDELRVHDRLTVTPGLRIDLSSLPDRPVLSEKLNSITSDPYFGTSYSYTPLSRIQNKFMNKVQFSPRIGFRWEIKEDRSLILRGGAGIFTGRIPFAWLAYAYYNTGDSYGAFDQRADQNPFTPGSDAIKPSLIGLADFIGQNGVDVRDKNSGKTQVDLVDNNFVLPQVFRSSLGLDYQNENQWKFTLEALFTKTIKDVLFQQVNTQDNPLWYGYDTDRKQPIYRDNVDSRFSNIYLLSNTREGYRYSFTATVSKQFDKAFSMTGSYTFGESKDISNGVRNSMESNWQLNQSLQPNNPTLAYSNFDIRHRIVASLNYNHAWKNGSKSFVGLFFSAQSGSPFSYGIVNNSIQGIPQQVSLIYIPKQQEAIHYFKDITNGQTAGEQADAFNSFINGNEYLQSRRGMFTERNTGRTPWNLQADLKLSHDIAIVKESHLLTISADIINLTNMLNRNWGVQYFSANTFNSTSSVGLTPTLFPPQENEGSWPVYRFNDPGRAYSVDYFNSRTQVQLGVRYSF